jgi:hypothetical protein
MPAIRRDAVKGIAFFDLSINDRDRVGPDKEATCARLGGLIDRVACSLDIGDDADRELAMAKLAVG